MRDLDSLKPAEIRPVVQALMNRDGSAEVYELLDETARRLGSNRYNGPDGRPVLKTDHDRFAGRVRRALEGMAAEGKYERVSDGRTVTYYTPLAYKAHLELLDQQAKQRRIENNRWQFLQDGLQRHGFDRIPQSLDEWEALLGYIDLLRYT